MVKTVGRDKLIRNKNFNPKKYGMVVCQDCKGNGYVENPKRQCCPKCGGFGYIKKEKGDFDNEAEID